MTMSFLSSFRIGQQTVYPEELRERLADFRIKNACKTLVNGFDAEAHTARTMDRGGTKRNRPAGMAGRLRC